MTSGATYCGVPQMVSRRLSDREAFLASPKSAILMALMSPGAASSRFSSFRSRWTTPLRVRRDLKFTEEEALGGCPGFRSLSTTRLEGAG